MIKVCSLDYLNKEFYETDIVTADGRVLASVGDRVSPDVILALYFKEVYVPDVSEKKIYQSEVVVTEEILEESAQLLNIEQEEEQEEPLSPTVFEEAEAEESSSTVIESNLEESEAVEEELLEIEVPVVPEVPDKPVESILVQEPEVLESQKKESGPIFNLPDVEEKTEVESKSQPKPAIINFDQDPEEDDTRKPVPPSSKFDDDIYTGTENISVKESEEVQIIIEDPEKAPLVFDENKAKKNAAYAVKLAKMLNFSPDETKDVEEAAYYYDIGISKFTRADLTKKNFKKAKALESYNIIINEKMLPDRIADAVKFSVNDYDSSSFQLTSKIPYSHIISVTGFYSEFLIQGHSKEEALAKMLQMGGNKFNIFILHKFIKMMREENE